MRQRKIGDYALSEREPQRATVSRTNVGAMVGATQRFVDDFLRGIVKLDIRVDEYGDIDICTYFFSYALRMVVAECSPKSVVTLEMTNTEDEMTIRILYDMKIGEMVTDKLLSSFVTAGLHPIIEDGAITLRTRFYPTPFVVRVYARTLEAIYLDYVDIFFH